jgi:hypothetical protein
MVLEGTSPLPPSKGEFGRIILQRGHLKSSTSKGELGKKSFRWRDSNKDRLK